MKLIKAWAVLVPGTKEPMSVLSSDLARGTRQYILFCDPDAERQAYRLSESYPEGHRYVTEVLITPLKPSKKGSKK